MRTASPRRWPVAVALILAGCGTGVITPHFTAEPDASTTPSMDAIIADAGVPPVDAGHALDAAPTPDTGAAPIDAGAHVAPPALLSETGLYADTATGALAPGVMAFAPRFQLWSDGAKKRRWLWLPDRARIDTTDMDAWRFPVGTKAWKEFTRDGIRVETRLIWKSGPNRSDWVMVAYEWNADQTDAAALPTGGEDRRGTDHDVPSAIACKKCHDGIIDRFAGVSAIQLDHKNEGLTLFDLAVAGTLTATPSGTLDVPGDALVSDTLGYLHANCGNCHNPRNVMLRPDGPQIVLWLDSDELDTPEATATYRTTVGRRSLLAPLDGTSSRDLVVTGSSAASLLSIRMHRRGENSGAMPPLGTELIDLAATASVAAWIDGLPD